MHIKLLLASDFTLKTLILTDPRKMIPEKLLDHLQISNIYPVIVHIFVYVTKHLDLIALLMFFTLWTN